MSEKQCFKCGEVKDLSCFYKHPQMKDGHVNKCKICNQKDVKNNRLKKIEHYRDYDRKRGSRLSKEEVSKYRSRNRIKYLAHNIVNNAIKSGKLVKSETCEQCGKSHTYIHGHHDDYALPLNVRWLCPPCHSSWHSINGMGKNSF